MQRCSFRFAIGFIAALAIALLLNVLPHLWMRFNDVKDGYDTFGFPLTFQRDGGFAGIFEFHYFALVLDVALALLVALGVGLASTRNRRRLT